jgi:hypothetical protein
MEIKGEMTNYVCRCGTVYIVKGDEFCYDNTPCDFCLRCGNPLLPGFSEISNLTDGYYMVSGRNIVHKEGDTWTWFGINGNDKYCMPRDWERFHRDFPKIIRKIDIGEEP